MGVIAWFGIVPKSMNPLWGLKQFVEGFNLVATLVPKSMNPLWGLKPNPRRDGGDNKCSQKHESSLGIETILQRQPIAVTRGSQKHESSLGIETTKSPKRSAAISCSQKHESSLGIETRD